MMTCSALVFLMIPGISFFYSGLSDRKSAISLARLPLMTTTVVGCQVIFTTSCFTLSGSLLVVVHIWIFARLLSRTRWLQQ